MCIVCTTIFGINFLYLFTGHKPCPEQVFSKKVYFMVVPGDSLKDDEEVVGTLE